MANQGKPVIRPRPKTREELRQLQRDLYELSKPFVRAKCDVLARELPVIQIHTDGRLDALYRAEARAEIARYDAMWREARESFIARNGLDCAESV